MRARLWFVPLALVALFAAGAAKAEPIGPHWQFTPFGGFTIFDPKLRFPDTDHALRDNLYVGGRLGYQTRSWLGLEAAGGFAPSSEDIPTGARDYDWTHASGNLMLSPTRGRYGNPFVFAGFGGLAGVLIEELLGAQCLLALGAGDALGGAVAGYLVYTGSRQKIMVRTSNLADGDHGG